MASIIRIKRSSVSGNPATLAAGELAYSALTDNGSNGGDRLYIGIGTETSGNAANHFVIGGKYFTDMLDQTPGILTASSALVVDSNKKLDELLVDDLSLNGRTVSSTADLILSSASGVVLQNSEFIAGGSYGGNRLYLPTGGGATLQSGYEGGVTLRASTNNTDWVTVTLGTSGTLTIPGTISTLSNGNLTLSPNGSGKTLIINPYIGDTSTSLAEYIYDTVGGAVTAGTGISISNNDGANTSTIAISDTTVTAGSYGSSTAIPTFTVNAQGQLTAAGTANVATTLGVAGDTGTDSISLLSETLTIAGGTGLTSVTSTGTSTVTLNLDNTAGSAGSYGSSTAIPVFTVDAQGRLTAASTASITTTLTVAADTGTGNGVALANDTLTFTGGEGIDTSISGDTVTISAELATSSNLGVASFNTSGFVVTSGDVALKSNVVQGITTDTGALTVSNNAISILGGEGIDVTHSGTAITVAGEDATTTNKGVASFDTNNFTVTSGAVSAKTITLGTSTLTLGSTTLSLAGLDQIDVDNIRINGNEISATDTNGGISLKPNGTGHISANSANIQNLANPVLDQDAATKWYVDHVAQGLHVHAPVQVVTTGTLASITGGTVTYTSTGGGTLTLQNALTSLDSYSLQNGDRILVAYEATASRNGIYTWATGGTVLTRAEDANVAADLAGGDFVFVIHGNTKGDTGWVQTEVVTTLGSDPIVWQQFSGAGTYTAGLGLVLDGTVFNINLATNGGLAITSDELQLKSTVSGAGLTLTNGVLDVIGTSNRITVNADSIDIASTYVGQSSITTLGTISSGTWQGDVVAGQYGGTGVNNSGKTITLGGNLTTSGAYSTTLISTGITSVTLPTTGTLATLAGAESLSNKTFTNTTTFSAATASTSTTSGAVIVTGGVGIGGSVNIGTNLTGSGTSVLSGFDIDGGTY